MSAWSAMKWSLPLVLSCAAVVSVGARADAAPNAVRFGRITPAPATARLDGLPAAPRATRPAWLQAAFDARRAADRPGALPDPSALHAYAVAAAREGVVPLGLIDVRGDDGTRVFAAAALRDRTFRGARVAFRLDLAGFVTNDSDPPRALAFDPGDGGGFRPLPFGAPVEARYAETGEKTARVRATFDDGTVREAAFAYEVEGLVTPVPDDTLHVTATDPWLGVHGTGLGYVYRAPGHATLQQPIVMVEGFDLDNSMDWDVLYQLLNQENLAETLRAEGWDLVVLDFTDATVPIEENARVLESLLAEVSAEAPPGTPVPLVGASMGGLVGRYALAHLEFTGAGHPVNTFISFDAPHEGANIPLGIQYWLDYFSGQSADAATLLGLLNRPAAREMLVYHYTSPAGGTGQPDPARAGLLAGFAAVGDWPSQPRRVAVANGSGTGTGQGFAAGAQIIQYAVPLLVRGNVWAVPDGVSTKIFDGLLLFTTKSVTVSGTRPYDSAPGGSRATMAEMDAVQPPTGDIVALYDSHCFIPTVSALAYDTADLFHDVAADPDPLAHTPFDAIYYPTSNQAHVAITPENAAWLHAEITAAGPTAVGPAAAVTRPVLEPAAPNPFADRVSVRFVLPSSGPARVTVLDVTGRQVRALASGTLAAGRHALTWDGRDDTGTAAAPGLYFVRLQAMGEASSQRLIRVR